MLYQWESLDEHDFENEIDVPHIITLPHEIDAPQLKLLDTEIEFIRSGEFLHDEPTYGLRRPVSTFEKSPPFIKMAPVEILSEIFMACVPHWGEYVNHRHGHSGLNTMDRTRAPWVLTQVCSEWRFIALSLPGLWSRIVICPDLANSEIEIKILLLSLEISLLRSANALLFVWLHADEHSMHYFEKPWAAVLDALMRHSKRWEDAIIALEPIHIRQLTKIKGCIPSLRRLILKILPSSNSQDIGTLDMFASAPALYHFEISGSWSVRPIVPWSQLTHYCGDVMVTKTQLEVESLRELSSLLHASYNWQRGGRGTPSISHCTHGLLQSLSIRQNMYMLDYLILPALQTLSVSAMMHLAPVAPFIRRSSCILTSITLMSWAQKTPETDMIAIFEATPALTSLSLTDYSQAITGNIISRLTFNNSDTEPPLLPKLQNLYYRPYSIDPREVEQLVKMIESRWKVHPSFPADRIHSVCLRLDLRKVAADLSQLERLWEEGLDIVIKGYR